MFRCILNVFLSDNLFMPFSFYSKYYFISERLIVIYIIISQFLLIVVSFYLLLYPGKFADYFFWSLFQSYS